MISPALRLMGGFDNIAGASPFQAAGMGSSPWAARGQSLLGTGGFRGFGGNLRSGMGNPLLRNPGIMKMPNLGPQWNAPMASNYMKEYTNPIQGIQSPFFHFF